MDTFRPSDLRAKPVRGALRRALSISQNFTGLWFCLLLSAALPSAAAISISGPVTVCVASTNTYAANSDTSPVSFLWSLTNDNAGAVFLGDVTNGTVTVIVATNGNFDLQCDVDDGSGVQTTLTNIISPEPVQVTPLAGQIVCAGDTVIFSTTVSGSPGYTVAWRHEGNLLASETSTTLTLTNVSISSTGTYWVEVTGPCNTVSNNASLGLIAMADLFCGSNLVVECIDDVPAPDTNSVTATNAVDLFFLSDDATTNGCQIDITRTYGAVNSCGATSTCAQVITVLDTTAPLLAGLTNLVFEYGAAWDYQPPEVIENCGSNNYTLQITSTVTNPLCGNTYEAIRTWTAIDSCSNSTSFTQSVTVHDTTPPTFAGLTNQVIEFGDLWDFITPQATDIADGTNVTLLISSTTTNPLCGNTFEAIQTWTAIDSCSNSASFTQSVTVQDTTPPTFAGLTNQVIECGDLWNFETPHASDIADGTNLSLVITLTVTNPLCGATFATTRTWTATDSCSNSASFEQTVTIIDTTPPQIFCPSNIVVECVGGAGNIVAYEPTAFDGCDTNVTLVVTPPSGTAFSLGTNTVVCAATDDCGNTNQSTFLVIVVDTTPPVITCPPNLIVSEAPRDSGGAVVTFEPPTVEEACDSAPLLTATPPSGSVFPVGTNTVTWTAVDSSGNSNSCTFTIRVIPYRLFVVYNTDDSGPGSLRQAILDGNDAPDENMILFQLSGSGPFVINLTSSLPPITSPTILDGWSQSGSNSAPLVEVVGQSNAFDGLVLQSSSNQVLGLSLHGFDTAIRIEGAGGTTILGNYIGVDVSGTNALGNGSDGIYVNSPFNHIGGATAGLGNLISGNGGNGIRFDSPAASNNIVEGNAIGTAYDGITPLPNFNHGVFLTNGASANRIGGTGSNTGNLIAFNGANGVSLDSTAAEGNSILGNSIFENTALGIDLGNDGITTNDNDDSDTGANRLQNYPILSDARSVLGMTIIEGDLSAEPNTTVRLEFFLNDTADPSTNGEGRVYIGSKSVDVNGSGSTTFDATFALTAVYTQFISATATSPDGNTSEFSPVVQVRTPPIIESQPQSTNSSTGDSVTFCAQVTGTLPIQYQWRLNGVNIPDATNACYTIPSTDIADGGAYTVVVKNDLDAFASTTASLLLGGTNIFNLPTGDNFVDAVAIADIGGGTNGIVSGNNAGATLEPFEPKHAGKIGGRSVWYRWRTPDGTKGITTIKTEGSTFDTLLGVYQTDPFGDMYQVGFLTNLVEVASGEDDARNYASEVRFNAFYKSPTNAWYYIAVDAYDGDGGDFVMSWHHEKTSHMLPVILLQPTNKTVALGTSVTFTNFSVPECAVGHLDCNHNHWEANNNQKEKLTYQWYRNDQPLSGATNASYTISSVQPFDPGNYHVRVFTPWQYLDSKIAVLQIGDPLEQPQAVDKFGDLQFAAPIIIGGFYAPEIPPAGTGPAIAAASVARGFTGTQIFNTTGAATGPGEVICGVIGGSSEWLTLIAEASGTLFLNTDGSSYDTVMSVFQRNPTNSAALIQLACDNNSGLDGTDSSIVMPVNVGSTNYVLVDGVNGAIGILQLNYSLATTTILKMGGRTADGANILQVSGRPGLNFSVQSSANLKNWTTLVTTNAPTGALDYVDTSSIGVPTRYYRALILP
jgi:hypothetical protein